MARVIYAWFLWIPLPKAFYNVTLVFQVMMALQSLQKQLSVMGNVKWGCSCFLFNIWSESFTIFTYKIAYYCKMSQRKMIRGRAIKMYPDIWIGDIELFQIASLRWCKAVDLLSHKENCCFVLRGFQLRWFFKSV